MEHAEETNVLLKLEKSVSQRQFFQVYDIKKADLQRQHVMLPADLLFLILYKILILIQEILDNDVLRLFLGKSQRPEL